MKYFTAKFCRPRVSYKYGTQKGGSMIETVVSAGIVLTAIAGGFKYVSSSVNAMGAHGEAAKTADFDSVLTTYMRGVMATEAATDPCLKTHKLQQVIGNRQGALTPKINLATAQSVGISNLYREFTGGVVHPEWQSALERCSSATGNETCVVLTNGGRAEKRLALAVIKQQSFNFRLGKPTDSASCDNAQVLDPNNTSQAAAGIGIKANYFLVMTTKTKRDGVDKLTTRTSAGELLHTPSKAAVLASGGTSEWSISPLSTCRVSRCTSYPIPPDPGIDYDGWSRFRDNGAMNASHCNKCERARTYK